MRQRRVATVTRTATLTNNLRNENRRPPAGSGQAGGLRRTHRRAGNPGSLTTA
jgi:hypothetical protein